MDGSAVLSIDHTAGPPQTTREYAERRYIRPALKALRATLKAGVDESVVSTLIATAIILVAILLKGKMSPSVILVVLASNAIIRCRASWRAWRANILSNDVNMLDKAQPVPEDPAMDLIEERVTAVLRLGFQQ